MLPQLTKLPCLAFSEFARLPPDIVNMRHGEVHRRRPIEVFLIKTKVHFRVVEEPFVKVRSASNKAQLRLWARTLFQKNAADVIGLISKEPCEILNSL